ncbi:AAA family ATPase [Candidatus Saccharibacteria bacterium]|nr:AAA family ATPase [Candidatus Saccharibacteria bacterium]
MSLKDAKIVAFVGLAGAGKTSAVEHLVAKGYPKVYFGGIILEAMKEAGVEDNPANEKIYREELRRQEGNDFIAKRISKQIHSLIESGQHRIIADGLYSWTEYKYLKHEFPGELIVIAVISPRHLRHHRLSNRPIRPLNASEAEERDWAEIENIEKGGPIAIADYFVSNDGDLDHFYKQIDQVLEDINF